MDDRPKFKQSNRRPLSQAELSWAKERVKDVLFGCILNIRLKHAGICKKFICDMNSAELEEYVELITNQLGYELKK